MSEPEVPPVKKTDLKITNLDITFPRFKDRPSTLGRSEVGFDDLRDPPDTKMVWMNESAIVDAKSDTPVVGTRSLADCLGIGVYAQDIQTGGADHMRFEATHDLEGDNIAYAYGRLLHLARILVEKGGSELQIYLVNTDPKIRGEERNKRLRRALEKAMQDERVKDKIKDVKWVENAQGFKIDTRSGNFTLI